MNGEGEGTSRPRGTGVRRAQGPALAGIPKVKKTPSLRQTTARRNRLKRQFRSPSRGLKTGKWGEEEKKCHGPLAAKDNKRLPPARNKTRKPRTPKREGETRSKITSPCIRGANDRCGNAAFLWAQARKKGRACRQRNSLGGVRQKTQKKARGTTSFVGQPQCAAVPKKRRINVMRQRGGGASRGRVSGKKRGGRPPARGTQNPLPARANAQDKAVAQVACKKEDGGGRRGLLAGAWKELIWIVLISGGGCGEAGHPKKKLPKKE